MSSKRISHTDSAFSVPRSCLRVPIARFTSRRCHTDNLLLVSNLAYVLIGDILGQVIGCLACIKTDVDLSGINCSSHDTCLCLSLLTVGLASSIQIYGLVSSFRTSAVFIWLLNHDMHHFLLSWTSFPCLTTKVVSCSQQALARARA